jgi:NADPH:quinone reductase-like Zn-dependent oxidoreductase
MSPESPTTAAMQTLRFHQYGEPAQVLQLEQAAVPTPAGDRIRVRVHACGLNPADWALCAGLFAGDLPRGIGLDVSGTVDAIGEGVTAVRVGDRVLGAADYAGYPSAGAADYAVLNHWTPVPDGLDMVEAAALPMAVETAVRSLDWLGVAAGQTLLVNGAGTTVGFAAVQIALLRGAKVIATAGETFAGRLRALGAVVTPYGDGLVDRVREIVGGAPDLVFDSAPVNLLQRTAPADGVLADLVEIAGGDPRRVLTCVDFEGAAALGVRNGFGETPGGPGGAVLRHDAFGVYARLAAEGRFSVPIARTFALEDWRDALHISLSGHAHGKLMLLPAGQAGS